MDPSYYREVAAVEERHWWYEARRRIVAGVLDGLHLPPDARLLDAGCGSGGSFALLARYGEVKAFEPFEWAREAARARGLAVVEEGSLPGGVPFAGERFDCITLLDVLEHVEEDVAAVAALRARLAPGGRLVLTVPALPSLWSRHDEINHHFRRYTRASLRRVLEAAGCRVAYLGYFNTLLLPAVVAVRLLGRVAGDAAGHDVQPVAPALNRLLLTVFSAERHLVPRWHLPVGLSLLAVAEAPGDGAPARS